MHLTINSLQPNLFPEEFAIIVVMLRDTVAADCCWLLPCYRTAADAVLVALAVEIGQDDLARRWNCESHRRAPARSCQRVDNAAWLSGSCAPTASCATARRKAAQ